MPPTTSPGPANFNLKSLIGYDNHEFNSRKNRAPNWTMGHRAKTAIGMTSPGPANYGRQENMTRCGKDCSKSATMFKRTNELKRDQNPGPAHDAVDTYIYKGYAMPKYSIGRVAKDFRVEGPGPNSEATPLDVYKLRSPKFTMYERLKESIENKSPAANKYDIDSSSKKILKQNPAFSMYMPLKESKRDPNPGPSKYDLKSHNPFERYPAYSLGRRHSEYVFVPVLPMDKC